jgi:hypothetical protein
MMRVASGGVAGGRGARLAVSLEPGSAYEAVTRQMVLDMGEELREIKGRLNGLLFMVAGSVLLDVVLRVMGV